MARAWIGIVVGIAALGLSSAFALLIAQWEPTVAQPPKIPELLFALSVVAIPSSEIAKLAPCLDPLLSVLRLIVAVPPSREIDVVPPPLVRLSLSTV